MPHLLGAALAGLLCLTACADGDSSGAPGAAGDTSHAGGGGASEGGTAGTPSGGEAVTAGVGGEASAAGTAHGGGGAAGDAHGGGGAAGEAGGGVPSAAGTGGAPEEPPHITSSKNVGVMTAEQFKALCDERGGTVEVMPHCGGFATAKGFSYDSTTELLSEHTCAGANTCSGWNCAIPE